jgi:hypothetical protein
LAVNNIFDQAKYSELLSLVPNAAQIRQYDPANVSSAIAPAEFRRFAPDMADPLDAAIKCIGDIVTAKFTDDLAATWSDLFPGIGLSDLWPRYQRHPDYRPRDRIQIEASPGWCRVPHYDPHLFG